MERIARNNHVVSVANMFRKKFVTKIRWSVFLSALYAAAANPETRVRLVGESLELMCAVEKRSDVVWDFAFHSDRMKSRIIGTNRGSGQPANNSDRFQVDCNTSGTCRLVIRDIKLTDAGLFRCLTTTEQSSAVAKLVADLTVLAAVPTCTTVISYKTSYLLDDLKIRCQVNCSGTQQPLIHCRELSTDTVPSPATPVETGNSSCRSLSFTYDIDVDRITDETKFECTTSVNMKDYPIGHVQYTWRWPENRDQTQSDSRYVLSATTTTQRIGEEQPSSPPAAVGIGLVVIMLVALGVVIICTVVGVAVVKKRKRQVAMNADGQRQDDSAAAVYRSSSEQQHAYAEITARPPADVLYENVPRQEPHYINLNPRTVEHPSGTPRLYTKLKLRRGAEASQDIVEN